MSYCRKVFAAVCLVLFALGTGAAAQSAPKWVSVRSANFVLIGDADPTAIQDVANRMELFRAAFGSLSPQIELDSGKPTNVVVFRDDASYRPFKPVRPDGSTDDSVAGFFQAGQDANYITVSAAGIDAKGYGTIFHEYVHYLLDTNFRSGGLPPWLNEGLAEFYETFEIVETPTGRTISVGKPVPGHLGLLRKKTLIPPGEFFATDNKSLHATGHESRSFFYAQAWAVVHYLEIRDPTSAGESANIFELLKNKEAREKVLAEAFGPDLAAFETVIRAHVAKAAAVQSISVPAIGTASRGESARALTPAQTEVFLGDLLRQMGRLAEAEMRLKRALTFDPVLPAAHSSLGKLLVLQGRFADAKPHLAKAVAAGNANAYTHFNFAYTLSREGTDADGMVSEFAPGTTKQMLDSLRAAIQLDPNFRESYRLLALVQLIGGNDLSEAEAAIRKALEIQPNDPEDSLILAKTLLRREKYDEAKAVAAKISITAIEPRLRSEASEVVQAADEYFRSANSAGPPRQIIIGALPPLILKRSMLTDEDIAAIDRDRAITNLNVVLGRQNEGETRSLGRIEQVSCTDDGVVYKFKTPEESFELTGGDFSELQLSVLIEGEKSFEIGCNAKLADQPVVITYKPAAKPRKNEKGRLTAVAFVPGFFRLKSPEEMARARTIIVEDDRLFKSNAQKPRTGGSRIDR